MSCGVGSKEFKEYADMVNIPNSYRVWAYQMWMEAQKQALKNISFSNNLKHNDPRIVGKLMCPMD